MDAELTATDQLTIMQQAILGVISRAEYLLIDQAAVDSVRAYLQGSCIVDTNTVNVLGINNTTLAYDIGRLHQAGLIAPDDPVHPDASMWRLTNTGHNAVEFH